MKGNALPHIFEARQMRAMAGVQNGRIFKEPPWTPLQRSIQLENAMVNLSCELQTLRTHMDARFIEQRAYFETQLHGAIEKLNARIDSQTHLIIGMQVAVFLALLALIATALLALVIST